MVASNLRRVSHNGELPRVARFLDRGEAGMTERRAMYVRKNATSLSEQEKETFVEGLLALKKEGRYDRNQ